MGKGRDKIKKVVNSYRTDLWFRAEASVYTSCGINLTYSMYQALIGLTRHSAWFDALAIYYILLTASRVLMLFYVRNEAPDGIVELKRYRVCGYMLLALTFMICGLGLLLNNGGSEPKEYPGHMVYVVGTYTIFTLINSFRNLWNYRKLESPLISASKSFNLAAAFVSLYAFEAAFIALHRLLFANNLWLLNPNRDLLIMLMPTRFFIWYARDIVFRCWPALAVMLAAMGAARYRAVSSDA